MPMVLSEYCARSERRRIFAGVGGLRAECMSCGQLIAGPMSKLPSRFRTPVPLWTSATTDGDPRAVPYPVTVKVWVRARTPGRLRVVGA